jgi:predicted transcriptional regulator
MNMSAMKYVLFIMVAIFTLKLTMEAIIDILDYRRKRESERRAEQTRKEELEKGRAITDLRPLSRDEKGRTIILLSPAEQEEMIQEKLQEFIKAKRKYEDIVCNTTGVITRKMFGETEYSTAVARLEMVKRGIKLMIAVVTLLKVHRVIRQEYDHAVISVNKEHEKMSCFSKGGE